MGPAEAHLELEGCSLGVLLALALPARAPLQRGGGSSSTQGRAGEVVGKRRVCKTHGVAQHSGAAFRDNKPLKRY